MMFEYKGLKSTRVRIGIVFTIAVTSAYIWADVTAQQWIDFLQWMFMAYAASEVGVKGASAYKDKS